MIKQLAHICVYTSDLDETARFYREALGMEMGFDFVKDGEPYGYYLKSGNETFIEVFKGSPGAVGNINHVAFEVVDLDGVLARVRSSGYAAGEKKLGPDHSWQAWLEDPNGIRIELQQYTERSMQQQGGTCLVDW